MNLDLHVQPAGKATATAIFSQDQVDAIRGKPGRGRVRVVLRFEGHTFRTSTEPKRADPAPDVLAALSA